MAACQAEDGSATSATDRATKDRRPLLDAAELIRQAKRAKAELQRASEVPVPESDFDQNSVRGDIAEDGIIGLEDEGVVAAATHSETDEVAELGDSHGDVTGQSIDDVIRADWVSETGECHIFEDRMTRRLSYEELFEDGGRLHGWLVRIPEEELEAEDVRDGVASWQATLWLLNDSQGPWYGPSFGEEPEQIGDIRVRIRPNNINVLESQIRVKAESGEYDEWQPRVTWRKKKRTVLPADAATNGLFVFGGGS